MISNSFIPSPKLIEEPELSISTISFPLPAVIAPDTFPPVVSLLSPSPKVTVVAVVFTNTVSSPDPVFILWALPFWISTISFPLPVSSDPVKLPLPVKVIISSPAPNSTSVCAAPVIVTVSFPDPVFKSTLYETVCPTWLNVIVSFPDPVSIFRPYAIPEIFKVLFPSPRSNTSVVFAVHLVPFNTTVSSPDPALTNCVVPTTVNSLSPSPKLILVALPIILTASSSSPKFSVVTFVVKLWFRTALSDTIWVLSLKLIVSKFNTLFWISFIFAFQSVWVIFKVIVLLPVPPSIRWFTFPLILKLSSPSPKIIFWVVDPEIVTVSFPAPISIAAESPPIFRISSSFPKEILPFASPSITTVSFSLPEIILALASPDIFKVLFPSPRLILLFEDPLIVTLSFPLNVLRSLSRLPENSKLSFPSWVLTLVIELTTFELLKVRVSPSEKWILSKFITLFWISSILLSQASFDIFKVIVSFPNEPSIILSTEPVITISSSPSLNKRPLEPTPSIDKVEEPYFKLTKELEERPSVSVIV